MRLAVFSTHHFSHDGRLRDLLNKVKTPITLLLTLGKRGVEGAVETYAIDHGIPVQVHYPLPEGQPDTRSQRMIDTCDSVLALWDFNSEEVRDAIEMASVANKKTAVIKI